MSKIAKCRSCWGKLHYDEEKQLWHHEYCSLHEPEPIEVQDVGV